MYVTPRFYDRKPIVTISLVVVNVVIFCITAINQYLIPGGGIYANILYNYAFWPGDFLQGQFLWTLITNLFLHADFFHIFFNMLTLVIFGIDVEYGLGKINFILLYFFSGIIANLLHLVTTMAFLPAASLWIPTVGASGAIFGVMGAYLFLYPRSEGFLYFYLAGVRTKAWVIISIYVAIEIIYAFVFLGSNIAHFAHLGGFIGASIYMIPFSLIKKDKIVDLRVEHGD